MALDLADEAELLRQLGKALFLCGLGERIVHVGPLVVFALGGGEQIVGGGADALKLFEPHLGVLLFVVRGLLEERGDLLIALFLGRGGEEGVLVARLGFAREGGAQVLLGFGAGILVGLHGEILLFIFQNFHAAPAPCGRRGRDSECEGRRTGCARRARLRCCASGR